MLFNPFFQGPLYYDNPYFDQLFVDIDDRAETVSKMVISYRDVANPLRLQVVGGKGYGKSTLLNAVTLRILRQSTSDETKLLPVYCQISESMYKREPEELSELFYNKILEQITSLSELTAKGLKERTLKKLPAGMSKDVAEAAASGVVGIFNPLLSVVVPIARAIIETVWKKHQTVKPSLSTSSAVEAFIENASIKNLKPVLILDELDKADPKVLSSFLVAERRFFESQNRIIVLATSSGMAEQMAYAGGQVQEIHREFEHLIRMDKLPNLENTTQITYRRLKWAACNPTSFDPAKVIPPEIIERLQYASGGIPSALMQMCFQAVENAVQTHAKSISTDHLPSFVEEMRHTEDYLAKLSRSYKVIIRTALTDEKITASDHKIQKQARVTRSRLVQILGVLSKDRVMTSYKEGRHQYYTLTEHWKGVLDQLLRTKQEALD